jgi:ribonuclease J
MTEKFHSKRRVGNPADAPQQVDQQSRYQQKPSRPYAGRNKNIQNRQQPRVDTTVVGNLNLNFLENKQTTNNKPTAARNNNYQTAKNNSVNYQQATSEPQKQARKIHRAVKTNQSNYNQPKQNQSFSSSKAHSNNIGQKPQITVTNKAHANKLRIIPLGGMEEVGRNMTIFEYGNDIIILDMGLQFPEEDMFGIDYIIPNIDYLKGKEKNVRAVIFSHGHLDHIGAAPMLLESLSYPPIVARPLTLALLKNRQEDYKPNSTNLLKTIVIKDIKDTFTLGVFKIKLFQVEHSIMDAVGVIIETPTVTILHPGDWTLDKDDDGKPKLDFSHLANLKRPTVLMLESLGATDVRPSAPVGVMEENITKLITEAKGRIIIGTFASQIERINWIIGAAEKLGKKVVLDGRSMKFNVEVAQQLGYIKPDKHTMIKPEQMHEYPDNKIIILATGAQGENNASLSRILNGDHRIIKIQKDDTVIFSSSIIPGNERSIQTLKDKLYRQCDNVIHGDIMDVHVSGHANSRDILYVLDQIKPDYFIPVYAYHYMLCEAKKLAERNNFPSSKIFIMDNGQVAEFDKNGGKLMKEKVVTDYVMVDGLGVGDVSNIVMRDRKVMAEDGMIVVITTIDSKTGDLIGSPDIISRGFIYMKENQELIKDTRTKVKNIIKERPNETGGNTDDDYIKNKIRNDVGKFLFQKTKRRPMVLPVVIKV